MKRLLQIIKRLVTEPAYIKYYFKLAKSITKMWLAYFVVLFCKKKLYAQNVWLVTEKGTEARDNGYWFFKYIKDEHPEINAFFVITKNSKDLYKLEPYKNSIMDLNSFRHYIYSLAAKVSASSQQFGAMPSPTELLYLLSKNIRRKDQVVVFLKHGIWKDEMPHESDFANTGFDLFCCASDLERAFVQKNYGYPDANIKTLGLCRFDNLLKEHPAKKQILIMPTHRMWLHTIDTAAAATEKEKKAFETTDYYQAYSTLLSDHDFVDYVRKKDYHIVFYPHYALQSYIGCFEKFACDAVTIADREHYDVQQLLMESALLITDFSSVFFDFAYMGKPEIFFQFDEAVFRGEHYQKGYFDYRRDSFGPVYEKKEDVIEETKRLLDHDCDMPEIYRERADKFFRIRDANNCKRTFDEVYRKAQEK